MTTRIAVLSVLLVSRVAPLPAVAGDIRLSEVMYNPPGETDDLQYVELVNTGRTDADLSGWKFTRGITFTFPAGMVIPAGGYLVVARDLGRFRAHYGSDVAALGSFAGRLSRGGETLELSDESGRSVDTLKYSDDGDWPSGPDGYSPSLERICPAAESQRPENWAPSRLLEERKAGGTPGRPNDSYSASLPPAVTAVEHSPKCPAPEEEVTVTAAVSSGDRVDGVVLLYRVARPGGETEETPVPMMRVSGDSTSGAYRSVIPGQPDRHLVRFRIRATDSRGAVRLQPSENEPCRTYSYFTYGNRERATVPIGFVINVAGPRGGPGGGRRGLRRGFSFFAGDSEPPAPPRGDSAFIYVPAGGGDYLTFDHVSIPPRQGGYKVRFHGRQTLRGMTAINVIFEHAPRFVLAEPLAYELYRLAGVPAELTEHIRLWVDGDLLGYHLLVEQPNQAFLARNRRDTTGNLYKLLWYGGDLVGRHEKKTNTTTGHDDLIELVDGLNSKRGDELWEYIQARFNVEEMVDYFAVNMCISNWDGFFNNYFAYHDLNGTGKWEIYPWDEDKTWGDYDGAPEDYAFYDMPLTFGMNGAEPSGGGRSRGFFGGLFGGGGTSWWRPPGYFSGPLLADPQFRRRFLTRLKEICSTIFTEEKMFPIIDAMEKRLEPEVRIRAEAQRDDPSRAVRMFRGHMQSFRDHVIHRRKFILTELEKG